MLNTIDCHQVSANMVLLTLAGTQSPVVHFAKTGGPQVGRITDIAYACHHHYTLNN